MKNVEITDFWIKIKRVVNPEELKTLYIYPTKNADKYIFAGRYIFKGMTAERILKHFEKENFNLEQFLQNALSKKELEKLGRLYLGNLVLKYKSNLTEKENICIFAEMFLGIIAMKMDKNFIDEFVYKNFIRDSAYLLPKEKEEPIEDVVNKLVKEMFEKPLIITTRKIEESYITELKINNEVFAVAESKGYKYSRKKAYKSAAEKLKSMRV